MIAAYFAPAGGMLKRIARAGRRGRARLVTAAKSDNTATIAAARFTYGRLLKRGVEVFEYKATKLHTKLVVLDDIVHIGSSNLDIRSLYLNMELMLRVDDGEFAQMMRTWLRQIGSSERSIRRQIEGELAWNRLIRRNVDIFDFQPDKIHTTLAVVDDVVHMGSSNFDYRSFYINLEVMLRISDPGFANAMLAYFERELKDCRWITHELHDRRATLWRRLKWAASHFLVNIMDYSVTRRLNFRA
jgi:phosphatidylserine/phosphatidylglycerophosphate/cardiolipin synthase-like enzyme